MFLKTSKTENGLLGEQFKSNTYLNAFSSKSLFGNVRAKKLLAFVKFHNLSEILEFGKRGCGYSDRHIQTDTASGSTKIEKQSLRTRRDLRII